MVGFGISGRITLMTMGVTTDWRVIAMRTLWTNMAQLSAIVTLLVTNPDIERHRLFTTNCVEVDSIVVIIVTTSLGMVVVVSSVRADEGRIDGTVTVSVSEPSLSTAKVGVPHFKISKDIHQHLVEGLLVSQTIPDERAGNQRFLSSAE